MIQWCQASDIDNLYNLGLTSKVGQLDGLILDLTIDGVEQTLTFSANGNANTQAIFLSTLASTYPQLIFTTISYVSNLQVVINPNSHTVVINANTANALLGLTAGPMVSNVTTNAMVSTWFGNSPADPEWDINAINAAIVYAGNLIEVNLRTRYVLPTTISNIPADLVTIAVKIAGYRLLHWRGMNSNSRNTDIDAFYKQDHDEAIQEIKDYANNKIHPELLQLEQVYPNFIEPSEGTYLGICGNASKVKGYGRGY